MWLELEGRVSQRLRFQILQAYPFPADVRIVALPQGDMSDAQRLFFSVSDNTRVACEHVVIPVVRRWKDLGHDVSTPVSACIAMLPALAHLTANHVLKNGRSPPLEICLRARQHQFVNCFQNMLMIVDSACKRKRNLMQTWTMSSLQDALLR